MKRFLIFKSFIIIFLLNIFLNQINIFSTPIYNRYDPNSFHTIFGTDKFYNKKNGWLSLNLSPFYQHSSGAKNVAGIKVPEGDILGRWSMVPLFFYATEGSPTSNPFSFTQTGTPSNNIVEQNYLYFSRARRVLDGIQESTKPSPHQYERQVDWPYYYPNVEIDGRTVPLNLIPNPKKGQEIATNYTDEKEFTSTYPGNKLDQFGAFSIPIKYEKVGLRGQLDIHMGSYVGLKVKSGVVQYRQKPTFNDLTTNDTSMTDTQGKQYVEEYLMSEQSLTEITKELGMDISPQNEIAMEDTHVQLYLNYPWELKNDENEHIVSLIPFFSVGAWLPSGEEQDRNKPFSMPTGNDGFWAITLEGSINLDFPGMVQLALGGGANFYGSKDYKDYRVPVSKYQSGIYPWSAKIRKHPGAVWYVNASFMAKNFLDKLSAYFDYIHIEHEQDTINMRESDDTRNKLFLPSIIEENSRWKGDFVHGGLNYEITPGLELGLCFNAHITGVKIYRTTTILGTITFNY